MKAWLRDPENIGGLLFMACIAGVILFAVFEPSWLGSGTSGYR